MTIDIHFFLEKIISFAQNQDYDQSEEICLILSSPEFLQALSFSDASQLSLLQDKVNYAVDLINLQKNLMLDELSIVRKGMKALNAYQ